MRVFVYKNLNQNCWSIKALSGPHKGRVVAHAQHIQMGDVKFSVSEAGRQNVIANRKKEVHAGAIGRLHAVGPDTTWRYDVDTSAVYVPLAPRTAEAVAFLYDAPVSYNPYAGPKFYRKDVNEYVDGASRVILTHGRKVFARGITPATEIHTEEAA